MSSNGVVISDGDAKPGNDVVAASLDTLHSLIIPLNGENTVTEQSHLDGIDNEAIRTSPEVTPSTATTEEPSAKSKDVGSDDEVVKTSPEATLNTATTEEQPPAERKDVGSDDEVAKTSPEATSKAATTEEQPPSKKTDTPGNPEDTPEWKEWATNRTKIPLKTSVKWSNYEQFKNRYSPDEGLEIIEVLYGHPGLATEIALERSRRSHHGQSHHISSSRRTSEPESHWIQRVRIQSPAIIHFLSRFASTENTKFTWSAERPRVFFRPFTVLHHTLPLMKRCLHLLQSTRAGEEGCEAHDSQAPDFYGLESPTSTRDPSALANHLEEVNGVEKSICAIDMPSNSDLWEAVFGVPEPVIALQHVKKYIEFVEKHIVTMWREAASSTNHKVRFWDLPMIYRPGELIFVPEASARYSDKNKSGAMQVQQNIFKLSHVTPSSINNPSDGPADFRSTAADGMTLNFYHIDFDGETYAPIPGDMVLSGYSGEKNIRSLAAYPLRYAKDCDALMSELVGRGRRFLSSVRDKHLHYDGWTLIHRTFDADVQTGSQSAEHIEGDIIIDFKEGHQSTSDFTKHGMGSLTMPLHWDQALERLAALQVIDLLELHCWRAADKREKFMKAFDAKEPWLKEYETDLSSHWDDDELALLPQRLIAYSFRARKFFAANIDCITDIPTPKNTFKDLKIRPSHKKIVKSLIRTHFQKQQMRRSTNAENLDQDFIRGKGAGLVILLHGVPGVGKTTTAEAVALRNRKPLFAITSGDLGSTPGAVEKALKETFRLAQLWDCVLLLDEADLFLSRREVEDLERNSLVSVFLRVLEYYNGVLFLTTNRVGTIDEAFKSRIHLSLYYPPLSRKQTLEIFEVNIRRLREIEAAKEAAQEGLDRNDPSYQTALEIDDRRIMQFAKKHFNDHRESERWNGRQIRNAFQVAYSLAQSGLRNEDDSDDEGPDLDTVDNDNSTVTKSILDHEQFEVVSKSIERFDKYLAWTRGLDADRARYLQVRNDEFRDDDDRGPHRPRRSGPEQRPRYLARGPDLRLEEAPYHSRLPSLSGVSDVDVDDKGWGTDQTRTQKRRSLPQKGGMLPMRSSQSSTHLSPASPISRRARDEHLSQILSNSEDYSDEDNMSHRSSVGGGTAKHRSRNPVRDEYVDNRRF
ncbi:hypothetical protein VSDG_03102 [Cytospora chrysosperma]|uniref:AAA+ ATPase domain-containing protein n=1 Tax=Cytospora chrysosperma TaxID=252740 RepID=A0A423W8H5_CYTCH|nr:hypothetical protein VSDG_03102 [Valsa sordida]